MTQRKTLKGVDHNVVTIHNKSSLLVGGEVRGCAVCSRQPSFTMGPSFNFYWDDRHSLCGESTVQKNRATKPRVTTYTVTKKLFKSAVNCYSGELLGVEQVAAPLWWSDRWWVCTSIMLSHSKCYANLYELVKIEEWGQDIFVCGCFDEEQWRIRESTGYMWWGVRVTIAGDESGQEWVLGHKVRWERQAGPRRAENGQPGRKF